MKLESIPAVTPRAGPGNARAYPAGSLCDACQRIPPKSHWLCLACWRRWKRTGTTATQPPSALSPVDPLFAAWTAGFFEGEGAIRVAGYGRHGWGTLHIEIAQLDRDVLDLFADRWGGVIRAYPGRNTGRDYFRWRVNARSAAAFLTDIHPHLRSKKYRERVELGIAFQAQKVTGSHSNHNEAYRQRQLWYRDRFAELNRRGSR